MYMSLAIVSTKSTSVYSKLESMQKHGPNEQRYLERQNWGVSSTYKNAKSNTK